MRRQVAVITVAVAVGSFAAGGCSDDGNGIAGDRVENSIPPAERAALADGEITFDEYEASIEAVVACIADAGIDVSGPVPDVDRPGFLHFETVSAEADDDDATAIVDACEAELSSDVALAWALANGDPDLDRRVYQEAIDCVGETTGEDVSAIDVDDRSSLEALGVEHPEAYGECLVEANRSLRDR